ncbi:hypothetical protein [Streptomyces sp. NBC_01481]|uniref:hypothetical protein n=1 Tax=Streptomyces sp. NBC_01481 TaxID=2975869 RepID=UPI002257D8CB|nr:hypothetical protein [Streptomyces sp. NBC_01481]MCX4581989.1 hypothetical protein [Streptomyces sp. NBC_01481]
MSPDQPPPPEQPPTTPQPPSGRRTLTAALVGALAGAAIVGAAWYATSSTGDSSKASTAVSKAATSEPSTFNLTGQFTLNEGAIDDGAGGCEGTGGYEDISLGTSVTVYDAAGAVIATSSLLLSEFDETARSCTFDVLVQDVPAHESFYQVEIGHRGKLQLSAQEAKAGALSGSLG